MKLDEIVKAINPIAVTGSLNREILGIAYDSRQVRSGYLFAALPGYREDGKNFIGDAVDRGAVAVVSEQDEIAERGISHMQVRDGRKALGEVASVFHGDPSSSLQMIGITGTNGKTTVSFLIRDILRADKRSAGLVGTVCYEVGARVIPAARTTPEAPELQSMLAEMRQVGCKSAVLEVSSHALVQKRVWGISFDVAVFTNLTQDHLDYHGSMEDYFEAKSLLFRWLRYGKKEPVRVINADDPWGQRLLRIEGLDGQLVTYGCSPDAMVRAEDIRLSRNGSEFSLYTPWGDTSVHLSLMGRFNVSNVLGAVASCGVLGVKLSLMAEVVAACKSVPGRLEEIPTRKHFQVFVDYAHTDDALKNVLETLRESNPHRLIVVFGCGGNRDRSKRPAMGTVAARLADYSILTSDNPRREDPLKIIEQIREGFEEHENFEVVVDRAEAIRLALKIAKRGDIVLIAGKGHETFQELENTTVPFDDRQVAKKMVGGS